MRTGIQSVADRCTVRNTARVKSTAPLARHNARPESQRGFSFVAAPAPASALLLSDLAKLKEKRATLHLTPPAVLRFRDGIYGRLATREVVK